MKNIAISTNKDYINSVVLSHPGQQHSFQTATALKKSNMLNIYCTTVYLKNKSLTKKLTKHLNGNDIEKTKLRKCDILNDVDVYQKFELLGLLIIFFSRIFKNKKISEKFNNYVVDIFGKKIAKYCIKNNVKALISFDNNSSIPFKKLEGKKIIRILDVSAANRLFVQNIYNNDIKLCGNFAKTFGSNQLIKNEKLIRRHEEELKYSDYFIVASHFVKKSIQFHGISESKIKIVPYGVDSSKFIFTKKNVSENEKIRFLFVGNISEIKGIYYLLQAFKEINNKDIIINIVGGDGNDDIYKPYKEFSNFFGTIRRDKMPEIYTNHDVLIFPSLADGFGLSIMEALSSGLPCIVTENSGASDIITNYENGFIIPIQDVNAIKEKVLWFVNNKKEIEIMSIKARDLAEKYDWARYYNQYANTIIEILEENI
jgi:glycosyltransferase involved in cell wall biosynthesis